MRMGDEVSRLALAGDDRLATSAARPTSSATWPPPWRQRPRTYPATMSGSVESGRPTPTARARSPPSQARPQRLQAVVARQPPPTRARTSPKAGRSRRAGRAGGRGPPSGAARRPDRAPGLVHVGLRPQHADPRAAGPVRPRRSAPRTSSSAAAGPSGARARRRRGSRRCAACARSARPGCPGRRPASRPAPSRRGARPVPRAPTRWSRRRLGRHVAGVGVGRGALGLAGALADALGLLLEPPPRPRRRSTAASGWRRRSPRGRR